MKNNDKMKWYILIAVALVVGAMVGYFATNSLSTTGDAKAALRGPEILTDFDGNPLGELDIVGVCNCRDGTQCLRTPKPSPCSCCADSGGSASVGTAVR